MSAFTRFKNMKSKNMRFSCHNKQENQEVKIAKLNSLIFQTCCIDLCSKASRISPLHENDGGKLS